MQDTPINLEGKVCVVTGANSGIGKETALALARMQARVVMVCRNKQRGEEAQNDIIRESGSEDVDLLLADLSSLEQVRNLASEFKTKYDRLDVLVNNAGGIFQKRFETIDGFEMTFALNYLSPVLLTNELMDILKASAPSRIVNISSAAERAGKIDLSDLNSETKYSGFRAYGTAKRMIIMYTYYLAEKLKATRVTINVLHPGFVRTNFGQNSGSIAMSAMMRLMKPFAKNPRKGAETSIYLASSPEVMETSGKYFANNKEQKSSDQSYNRELQERLWEATHAILEEELPITSQQK